MLALPGASAHKLKVEEENESAEYFWWHMSHLRMAPLEDNPPPRFFLKENDPRPLHLSLLLLAYMLFGGDDNDFAIMESEKEMREEG